MYCTIKSQIQGLDVNVLYIFLALHELQFFIKRHVSTGGIVTLELTVRVTRPIVIGCRPTLPSRAVAPNFSWENSRPCAIRRSDSFWDTFPRSRDVGFPTPKR